MAFLRNDAVNRVNLHSGIQALAQGAGGIFFLVFLLRAGVPVPIALAAQAAIVAGRFVLRPALLPLAIRFGIKPLLIAGTLGLAVQYPLLAEVDGVVTALLVLCIAASLGEVFYWVSYNAYFAAIGDTEHRGHQVGAREALIAIVGIVAPLLGAWALTVAGPRWTFAVIGLIQASATIPLIGAPNVAVRRRAPGAFKAARLGATLMVIDGWFDSSYIFVWQIALFVSLSGSIPAFGGAMAIAGLAGAVCGLLLGRNVDRGHGRRVAVIAYGAAGFVIALRAASLDLPWLAVTANALGALLMPLLVPALGTATYNMAKRSPCPFRFKMATEGGWDAGCFAACLLAAALSALGVPLSLILLLGLPATAAGGLMLWRYYGREGGAAERDSFLEATPNVSAPNPGG